MMGPMHNAETMVSTADARKDSGRTRLKATVAMAIKGYVEDDFRGAYFILITVTVHGQHLRRANYEHIGGN